MAFAAAPRRAVLVILLFMMFDLPLSQPLIAHVLALVAAISIAYSVLQSRPAPE